ncbi:MAG: ABC transporter permease [Candidatus Acidiferrales bacterium]
MRSVKNTWILSKFRVGLALRNRTFIFFSLVFPLTFLFLIVGVFGRGNSFAVPYLLGPVLALSVMGSFWGLSMQLVMFREQGILRRFRLAPVGAGPMLASSIIANYVLIWPTIVLEFLLTMWIFHMRTLGDIPSLIVLVSVGSATFSSFGLIVASVTNSMQETQVLNNVIWSAFLFLSGATIPLVILPGWIQHMALFLPATYLVAGLQNSMVNTETLRQLAGDTFVLLAGLAVAFEISRQLFRWDPGAKVPNRSKAWVVVALVPFILLGFWENSRGGRLNQIRAEFNVIEQHRPASPQTK